ncbi:MAG: PHP domain-containing protein [Byssovorax sp.]
MRKLLPLALFLAVAPGLPSCGDSSSLLRAKVIEQRAELVGGPVAMADVGDFILENDQIRVAILGVKDSPGPGVYGGSIVDIDLRRSRQDQQDALGRDRFAELFPVANLLVPNPKANQVTVLADGKDGKEAAIRVDGKADFLFEALGILRNQKDLLRVLFPDVKTEFLFRTDYILHPGDRHITIRTTLFLNEEPPPTCPPAPECDLEKCPGGFKSDAKGCFTCECDEPVPLELYTEPVSVFGEIFGDNQNDLKPKPVHRAGMVAGDFVFFGNQNDVWAPGMGFDEEQATNDAFYAGRNTFQKPLSFDFMAASGGDISYGYFTVPKAGDPAPVVNVPLITSAATAFLAAGKSCLFDKSDDQACDFKRSFTYERYLAVGDGDIASVAADVWKTRGTPTGKIDGVVVYGSTGEPAPNASVDFFADPDPAHEKDFANVDEVAEANLRASGAVGLLSVADADVGLDVVEDGDFHTVMPEGTYIVVARSSDGMALSKPERLTVKAGDSLVWNGALPTPATVLYRVSDASATLLPAKVAVIALDSAGKPLARDGRRRVWMGDGRLGDGARFIEYSATGTGSFRIEPGRYQIRASRGPEYSIFEKNVEIGEGELKRFDAILQQEIDTTGWMSTDMHLHSEPSFDSGMLLAKRVTAAVDEQVELAIPTDHDVETDYTPTIRQLNLAPWVQTAVSVETTTLEQGHFIGFPFHYDKLIVPTHGSHDPTCESGGEILAAMAEQGDDGIKPFTICAHPRDGFFGYIDQLGVDPFTMNRKPGLLEEKNRVFRTASCDFDGMEIINGKRFDLVRTPTIEEVMDWNRCRARVDAAQDMDALAKACPEVQEGMLAPCSKDERFNVCRDRNRTALAWSVAKRILTRTPEEQEALWNFPLTAAEGQELCSLQKYGDGPVPRPMADLPCTHRSGHIDDYFRYLERGMIKTQVGSSDSHASTHEPGSPRTYFMTSTDSPPALTAGEAVDSLRAGHALATYGPFIRADVDGKTFGDVAAAQGGGKVSFNLEVQTASWFGVDRIEVYEDGHLVKVIEPKADPKTIVDFKDTLSLDVPAKRDSWIVVVAMGLQDQNLMTPISIDVNFGEIQLAKVTADAFALIPVVNALFTPVPTVPDWYPIPAYAVTNPIYLDTDGNGKYDAPLPYPNFCSKPCDSSKVDPTQCPTGQKCLNPENVCGLAIVSKCDHRTAWGAVDH